MDISMYSGKNKYNFTPQSIVFEFLTRTDPISLKKSHGDKFIRYFILYVITVLIRKNAQTGVRAPILKALVRA